MKTKNYCVRCEVKGTKPKSEIINITDAYGEKVPICKQCLKEIQLELNLFNVNSAKV